MPAAQQVSVAEQLEAQCRQLLTAYGALASKHEGVLRFNRQRANRVSYGLETAVRGLRAAVGELEATAAAAARARRQTGGLAAGAATGGRG